MATVGLGRVRGLVHDGRIHQADTLGREVTVTGGAAHTSCGDLDDYAKDAVKHLTDGLRPKVRVLPQAENFLGHPLFAGRARHGGATVKVVPLVSTAGIELGSSSPLAGDDGVQSVNSFQPVDSPSPSISIDEDTQLLYLVRDSSPDGAGTIKGRLVPRVPKLHR